jgi:hypothetical protein
MGTLEATTAQVARIRGWLEHVCLTRGLLRLLEDAVH